MGRRAVERARCRLRAPRRDPPRPRGQREPSSPAHPRPPRPSHRRGRVPPLVAPADGDRSLSGDPRDALARAPLGRPRGPRGDVDAARTGRGGGAVPDLDDLLGNPRPASRARPGGGVGATAAVALLRRRAHGSGDRQEGLPLRDGHDREAGRLGRASQHHHRPAAERWRARRRLRDHRAQVVHVGADVRRLPRPRPGRGWCLVLSDAAVHPRRRAQPDPPATAQGQARQPLERLLGGRVPRGLGTTDRRGGPRRSRRSSRWSTTPASTARWAPRRGCAGGPPRRSTTAPTARPSARP